MTDDPGCTGALASFGAAELGFESPEGVESQPARADNRPSVVTTAIRILVMFSLLGVLGSCRAASAGNGRKGHLLEEPSRSTGCLRRVRVAGSDPLEEASVGPENLAASAVSDVATPKY